MGYFFPYELGGEDAFGILVAFNKEVPISIENVELEN
jgi:hypothetical protein